MSISVVMSIMVLAIALLVLGGIALLRRGERRKGLLMLVLATIAAANVALWTVPLADGSTPAAKLDQR